MEDIHTEIHVNLPADNSHGCIRLTQHCFKGGRGWLPFVVDEKLIIVI